MRNRTPVSPQVAVGAVVVKEGKILLVKRKKPPSKGQWAIPGGSVKLGETLKEATEREIREETGSRIKAKKPVYTFDVIERDEQGRVRFHYVIVDLVADVLGGELHPSDDAADAAWFGLDEIEHAGVNESTRAFLHEYSCEKTTPSGA